MTARVPLDAATAEKALVGFRGAMAVGWLYPRQMCAMFRIPNRGEKQRDYWLRMFATRDVALAATIVTATPETKPLMLKIGIATDAVDTVGAAMATRNRDLPLVIGALMTVLSAATAALGVVALQGQGQDAGTRTTLV
jgi:hypothetical protein